MKAHEDFSVCFEVIPLPNAHLLAVQTPPIFNQTLDLFRDFGFILTFGKFYLSGKAVRHLAGGSNLEEILPSRM